MKTVLALFAVFLCPGAFLRAAAGSQAERLPAGVVPASYQLSLSPDPVNLRFRGGVKITLDVRQPASSIVLNEAGLVLDQVLLDGAIPAASTGIDDKLQRATLTFPQPVSAGRHTLTIDYQGVITKGTIGFFAMDYDSPQGKRRTIATNFEPAEERRFMPSWDEPAFKATLQLTADVPSDRMAVSNMPAVSTEVLPDGHKRVHFATTPKMSTYLFFFALGDFQRITTKSDGAEVGVVVNRGDAEKGRLALAEAARLLHYYDGYFGVPFPLPKLDLVVAPGSITGGAMENWGAIFYSQNRLLFDPAKSTEADRQLVFQAVAHEMAHQWFGDLVTIGWWDDLWLNEGFARWMQTKAADDLHPEWKTGLKAFGIAESGKRADAKPSTHPIIQPVLNASQADQAFDEITYDKGAAVISMLEAYVTPDAFRSGVRRYMRAHQYGNTVDADFWREVQAASGKPVLAMEADFTRQPGVPLIKVQSAANHRAAPALILSEGRFVEDPSTIRNAPAQQWRIPIAIRADGADAHYVLQNRDPIPIAPPGTGPAIVNAGQTAYARVLYPDAMIARLIPVVGRASTADQLGLLYDSWAEGESGYALVTNYLAIARAIPVTADPLVWRQIVWTLSDIERLYPAGPGKVAFVLFATNLLRPVAARVGWETVPHEDPNAGSLRNDVLDLLSRLGDRQVVSEARRRFELSLKDPQSVAPAVLRTALQIVAYSADPEMLDRLIAMARSTKDPLEKQHLFEALSGVADPAGAAKIMAAAANGGAPAGFAPTVLMDLSISHPDLGWSLAMKYLDRPDFPIDDMMKLIVVPSIAALTTDPARIADLEAYADKHFPPSARENVESAVASIKLNSTFRAERIPAIDKWLATQSGAAATSRAVAAGSPYSRR